MKLSTLLVAGSLAANAALVAVYVVRTHSDPAAKPGDSAAVTAANAAHRDPANAGKKSGDANAAGTTKADGGAWAKLNTGDLRALAARLRAAGFPPEVVRAVIGMQIAESFKARREQLMPSREERPFWKTDASGYGGYDPKFFAAMRDLAREQGKLMKEILGDDANGSEAVSDYQRKRYGNLSSDKIEQLQRLDQDYNDMRNEVNMAARGIVLPEDREKLAMLEQERRADLAQLLSPQEMEDYLMRTSQTTNRLRSTLTMMNASEAEYRAIYQAQSAFDEKYMMQNMGGIITGDMMKERQAAQAQTNDQIKAALGDERYAEYARASDREFQQLNRLTQQASLPDSAAQQVYDLRNNTLKESNRIYEDASLAPDQKRAAIQALGQTARAQVTATLGEDVGSRYLQVANRWLSGLDRGAAVTLNENGGMNIRGVPGPRSNAPGGANPPSSPASPAVPTR